MKKRVIVRLTRGSERSPYHRTSQKMLQKKQSIIGSDMIHWYNMYAFFPLFVNHAAKLLHFFDICKMERDFSMRIMPSDGVGSDGLSDRLRGFATDHPNAFCSSSLRRWNSSIRYNLNGTLIAEPNSNAISLCA